MSINHRKNEEYAKTNSDASLAWTWDDFDEIWSRQIESENAGTDGETEVAVEED